ncbi:MAG: hypothetical protein FD163_2253 [Hyphomonadaceae bacterium]|nr:MAG: hypothetical protein FD128_711 [Hyphomonadaceae bacterium]KAF0183533.1 MAG: hypothetical protein FD163_2253 [Hyphomonadaceae bacterium]
MKIVFADETIVVIDKPTGLLSVPGRGVAKQDCALTRLHETFSDALIVHRLDMATSGLMVLARNIDAHRHLSSQFANRKIDKKYIAIVHSIIGADGGEINAPLISDWPNRPKQKVDYEIGKPSLTKFKVLSHDADTTRVELIPTTGRTHQLRVHMLSIGHPICGDALYFKDEYPRLMLHARFLQFAHPKTSEKLSFASAPDF